MARLLHAIEEDDIPILLCQDLYTPAHTQTPRHYTHSTATNYVLGSGLGTGLERDTKGAWGTFHLKAVHYWGRRIFVFKVFKKK